MRHAAGLYYEEHGDGTGAPLILSAGLGGSASYWAPNTAAFAKRYRVIAYDHRGTGRSDRALPDALTIAHLADDLVGLMDTLGIARAHVVGHAVGGLAGLALALAAPARLERLAIVNGWARIDPYTERCFDARLALLRDSGPEAFLRAQPIFLYPACWTSAHSAELDAQLPGQLAHFPGEATMEQRIAALRAFDVTARLGEIAHPVLVLATADDMLVPAHAARPLAEGLRNATRMLQCEGGHASNVTEPDAFHDLVLPWLAGEPMPEE